MLTLTRVAGDEPLSQFAFRRGLENDFCVKNYILQWGMEDTKPSRYGECYAELREWMLKLLVLLISLLFQK
jgi:hypothetical protein